MDGFQIFLGTGLILAAVLLPGLSITLALFPKWDDVRWAERLGLGLVFGITPELVLYFLSSNIQAVPVTSGTTLASIFLFTAAGLAVYMRRKPA